MAGRDIFLIITEFPDIEQAASFALMLRLLTRVLMVSTIDVVSINVLSTIASGGKGHMPTFCSI
jgi:hypothetical protein